MLDYQRPDFVNAIKTDGPVFYDESHPIEAVK